MRIDQLYRASLNLYPTDYRVRFASEMRAAFEAAARDRRRNGGWVAYLAFLAAEASALAVSIGREWAAKLASDPTARARALPDRRYIRPVGVTRAEWTAGLEDTHAD
jgi:hypothetical protein